MTLKRLLLLFLSGGAALVCLSVYPDFLWFSSFDVSDVWFFRFKSELITWLIFTLIALAWLSFQLMLANQNSKRIAQHTTYAIDTPFEFLNRFIQKLRQQMEASYNQRSIGGRFFHILTLGGVIVLSVFFGLSAKAWWEELYLYLHQVPYGITDPVFNHDISFYLFSVPLFNLIQNWFAGLFLVSLVAVGWVYFSRNILLVMFAKDKHFSPIKTHVIGLLSVTFLLFSIGTWLGAFDLLYSSNGVVQGASYTDVTVLLPVKKVLMVLFLVEAILLLFLIKWPRFKWPYIGLFVVFIVHFFGQRVLPQIVQSLVVAPNELVKEEPYIKSNIDFTREAYGINTIKETDFPVKSDLTKEDIKANPTIIGNIRLWNQEPLKQTFSQLQEIRLYYEFENVDVDRYVIDGKPQQVMLSAREIDGAQLTSQAQTWTNRHLVYTHGYGLCMTPVNQVTEDGLPKFYIKDLPPVTRSGLSVTRPEIYFGEKRSNYVVVNTKQKEFDYPKGDSNIYTHYKGSGGIVLDTAFKRLVYSFKFSDFKLFLSSQLTDKSRLLYERSITEIVQKIAPFLSYDRDPYLVVTQEGRLVWMLDAYTLSNRFPYSEPFNAAINYIRNAVKVTIDAYNGTVRFYVMDQQDPLIKAYAAIYPTLFRDIAAMPSDLQSHLKYPKDLFTVQALMLNTYHMQDSQVFYNREDLWEFPKELYEGVEKTMAPYYLVTRLPNEEQEQFVLMLPFTPTNKNNMIAWLAASSDKDTYGDFTVLKLPKEKTIYGPMQIESRIDQDTDISKDLTLWGQMGSRVIRGNLMIIPIQDALLYVEPIYLQAETSKMPELKRVIVSYRDKVVMKDTLLDAIADLFQFSYHITHQESPSGKVSSKPPTGQFQVDLIDLFENLKASLSAADWAAFAADMTALEAYINEFKKTKK